MHEFPTRLLKISVFNSGLIKVLLEFDEKNINQLASLSECISFYTQHFHKLDNTIKELYTRYLNQTQIIRPLQDY